MDNERKKMIGKVIVVWEEVVVIGVEVGEDYLKRC